MSFVRNSKFRHVFGNPLKENYSGIKVTANSADSTFCAVNPKFVAIVIKGAGGGPFLVLPLEKTGRLKLDEPVVNGHTSAVVELAWSPFNDNLIASCSEDCTIKLWDIPDEGIIETLKEPWQSLHGHEKRVSLLEWHPSAEYILASGSSDNAVFIWNVLNGELMFHLAHPDVPTCLSWNHDGFKLATTCKDKKLRVFFPQKDLTPVAETKDDFFRGSKPSKCVFLKDDRIFCVGFSRMSTRLYALWDSNSLVEPLVSEEVDNANGTVYLHYDPDNNIVFTVGKGDAQIKYYELTDVEPYVHYLSMYQGKDSQRGGSWMPKRGLDYTTCEIARFYKLTEDKCEAVSLIVPRKSDLFQDDIYPPCCSDEPALAPEAWASGKVAPPRTMEIRPLFDELKGAKGKCKGSAGKKSTKPVRSLSHRPAKTLSAPEQNGASVPPGINLEDLVEDVKKLKSTVRKVCRRLTTLEKQLGEVVAEDDAEEEEE